MLRGIGLLFIYTQRCRYIVVVSSEFEVGQLLRVRIKLWTNVELWRTHINVYIHMALNDVIFQDLFTSYVIPISGVLVIVALLKDSLRRFYLRIRSNISVHIDEVYERATCKHKEKLFAQLLQLSQSIDRPLKILELNIGYGDNFKYYPAGCDVGM